MSFLWEQNGKPQGQEDEFWHKAERELKGADERGDPAKESPDDIYLVDGAEGASSCWIMAQTTAGQFRDKPLEPALTTGINNVL
jgi:hypothetical protein